MLYSLNGRLVLKEEGCAAVECGGVAFKCFASYNTIKNLGSTGTEVMLYTYLSVREDALDLYAFINRDELDTFKQLIGVSGVGPKAALAILSEFTPDSLALAIASGDTKAITRAQGVGSKIAQRVVLELKGKLAALPVSGSSDAAAVSAAMQTDNIRQAAQALVGLGYSQSEAALALSAADPALSVEELIRIALRGMASHL